MLLDSLFSGGFRVFQNGRGRDPQPLCFGANDLCFHEMIAQLAGAGIQFVHGDARQQFLNHPTKLFSARGKRKRLIVTHHVDAISIANVSATSQRSDARNFNPLDLRQRQVARATQQVLDESLYAPRPKRLSIETQTIAENDYRHQRPGTGDQDERDEISIRAETDDGGKRQNRGHRKVTARRNANGCQRSSSRWSCCRCFSQADCGLARGTINRNIHCESSARCAGFSVAYVGELNERLADTGGCQRFSDGKTSEEEELASAAIALGA